VSFRLGIFGGTFDPIHLGHLLVAEVTRCLLRLDRVMFVPSRVPPHKGEVSTPAETRYRMVTLACESNPFFGVSDHELRRQGPSYTIETLRAFREEFPAETEHYLMIGADSARDFESWQAFEELLEESTVVVMGRPGVTASQLPERVGARTQYLSTPLIEISSSSVRRTVREGGSIRYMVTDPVEEFIRSERLYLS
jgi:nicotinate-nucleotide adenylyltransferase